MKAYFFTEMPYPYVPEEVERGYGTSRVVVPNSYCDPARWPTSTTATSTSTCTPTTSASTSCSTSTTRR